MATFQNKLNFLFVLLLDPFLRIRLALRTTVPEQSSVMFVKPDNVGDFLLWLECAKELCEHYSEHKRILVCADNLQELADKLGLFDEIIPVNRRKMLSNASYRWSTATKLRDAHPKTLIYASWSRDFFIGDAIVSFTQAGFSVGFENSINSPRPFWQEYLSKKFFSFLISVPAGHKFETDCYKFLLSYLKVKAQIKLQPGLLIDIMDRQQAKVMLNRKYFVVSPSATSSLRIWPIKKFASVIKSIYQKWQLIPVLVGTSADKNMLDRLNFLTGNICENVAGETSILELSAIIRDSQFLIGNESGPIHLAYQLNVPSVCIQGGGHFSRFVPYPVSNTCVSSPKSVFHKLSCFSCDWHCIQPLHSSGAALCVAAVQEEAVMSAVNEILNISAI